MQQSKINIIREPCIMFLNALKNVASNSKVTLLLFNDKTSEITGTFDELISCVQSMNADCGTRFDIMLDVLKQCISHMDSSYKKYVFALTDGMHNGDVNELLSNSTNAGILNLALGIGTEHNVECKLLRYLSGNSQDTFHLNICPSDVIETINGGCFEGLLATDNMKNVSFDIIFENNEPIKILGNYPQVPISEAEYQQLLERNATLGVNSNIICTDYSKHRFVISPKNTISETELFKKSRNEKMHFFIAIDVSGSMNDYIYVNNQPCKKNHNQQCTSKYVKVTTDQIATFTSNSITMFSGNVKAIIVNYNQNNEQKTEVVTVMTSNSSDSTEKRYQEYSDIISEISFINKLPHQTDDIKTHLAELNERKQLIMADHSSNNISHMIGYYLFLAQEINKYNVYQSIRIIEHIYKHKTQFLAETNAITIEWLKTQCTILWHQIEKIYANRHSSMGIYLQPTTSAIASRACASYLSSVASQPTYEIDAPQPQRTSSTMYHSGMAQPIQSSSTTIVNQSYGACESYEEDEN